MSVQSRNLKALRHRYDYLKSKHHLDRNSFDKAELAALQWVLDIFGKTPETSS